jgi:hypothetical protein
MLDPEEMEIFPFVPLEFTPEVFEKGLLVPTSRYWSPDPSLLAQEMPLPPTLTVEDWELSDLRLDLTSLIPEPTLETPSPEDDSHLPHFNEVEEVILPGRRTTPSLGTSTSRPRRFNPRLLSEALSQGLTVVDGKIVRVETSRAI